MLFLKTYLSQGLLFGKTARTPEISTIGLQLGGETGFEKTHLLLSGADSTFAGTLEMKGTKCIDIAESFVLNARDASGWNSQSYPAFQRLFAPQVRKFGQTSRNQHRKHNQMQPELPDVYAD